MARSHQISFRNMRPGSVVPLRPYASFDPGTKNRAPRSSHDDIAVTCAICASCVTCAERLNASTSRRPARHASPAPSDRTRAHPGGHEEHTELPGGSRHDDIAATCASCVARAERPSASTSRTMGPLLSLLCSLLSICVPSIGTFLYVL